MSSERLASDWTSQDAEDRYDLPGGQWVAFRRDVSYGAQAKLDIACKALENEEALPKRLAFHIVSWSLTYPNGAALPVCEESVAELPTPRIMLLLRALEQHMTRETERYADPLSGDDSTSASPSAA